jgi:sugar/nucleoside kinase (ribokinase family)
VNEVVISDGESRTVFGRYVDLLFTTPQWEPPDPVRIRAARIACVDPAFGESTLAVARIAKTAGKPLVTCDARHDSPLAGLAEVNVVSSELMQREYPAALQSDAARTRLFETYLASAPGLVVFTAGSRATWYGRRGLTPSRLEVPAFPIEVIDSAGAGDSFRGGLIYGMLQGWTDEVTLRFASAVAALVCTTAPGCVNSPTLREVEAFLDQHRTV